MNKKLEILATPFDDPSLCRFTLGVEKLSTTTAVLKNKNDCIGVSYLESLLNLKSVVEITLENNYLIVKKDSDSGITWRQLGPEVGKIIRGAFSDGTLLQSSFLKEVVENSKNDELVNKEFFETELGKKITRVLEMKVSPSLGAHGGSVTPVDFDQGVLFLKFSGGCQGCSQVSVTVRDGILKILQSEFTEIKDVRDVTDHEKGNNPYFS
tara:strand:+ start:250 stop:879 length:630 start_codon:yes stop_codon:yes gene_type:complete